MEKISATIITLNEERNIRRCLESVRWVDEIVVIDSFSSDRTVEIAQTYTNRVLRHKWPGYIEQKNYAVDCASHDWIFSLDADEQVSPQLRDSILATRNKGFRFSGYELARKTFYLGRWIRHGDWYPSFHIRLFDRRKGRWGGTNPHDKVILEGRPARLQGELLHYTYDNVSAHIRQINTFTTIAAEELQKMGKTGSLAPVLFYPFFKFVKSYLLRRGFLDGRAGLAIALMGSFYVFVKYLKLWELRKVKGSRPDRLTD